MTQISFELFSGSKRDQLMASAEPAMAAMRAALGVEEAAAAAAVVAAIAIEERESNMRKTPVGAKRKT